MSMVDLVTDTQGLVVQSNALNSALKDAAISRSRDPFRPALCGVHIQRTGDHLVFTGTDSYTLIERTLIVDEDGPDWTFVLDGDDVGVLEAHLKSGLKANAAIVCDGEVMTVTVAGRTLTLQAHTETPYPNAENLWPDPDLPLVAEAVALNPDYLARARQLSAVKGKPTPILVHFHGEMKPVVITAGEHTRMMVMPVRQR